jgi:hypothetical protein
MHPIFLEATTPENTHWWEDGINHTTIFLGLILTIFGILVAYFKLRTQHNATLASREQAVIERNDQKELLEEIAKEFRPNHGSSLVDRVNHIGTSVDSHISAAEVWFAENDKAHEEIMRLHAESCLDINRRVDGIYEIILGSNATTPRKTAARHLNREEQL